MLASRKIFFKTRKAMKLNRRVHWVAAIDIRGKSQEVLEKGAYTNPFGLNISILSSFNSFFHD